MEQEQEGRLERGRLSSPRAGVGRGRQRRRTGPWLLLLPLLTGAFAVRYALERGAGLGLRPRAPASRSAAEVAGRAGTIELAGAGRLVARLTRLHPSAEEVARQELEARTLRARLGLGPGEPYRLTLEWRDDSRARDGSERERMRSGELALSGLEVRDEEGLALSTLAAPVAPRGEPLDPLAVLLAPPREALRPGESIELVLWGREPGAAAELVGDFVGERGATEASATLRLPLLPRLLLAAEELELARLERGGGR